jgi:Lipocalin-like domain
MNSLFTSKEVAMNTLLGTWKLKSLVWTVTATGEKVHHMGEHPNGHLGYSADGRMYAIITAENRVKPDAANPTDEQRVKLHRTMIAYGGTYTVQADTVIHHVDISWNEFLTGADQVRFFQLDGNILTITSPPFRSPQDGREGRSVLVWEKVTTPTR